MNSSFNPLVLIGRKVASGLLENIKTGFLELTEKFEGGETLKFGSEKSSGQKICLSVLNPWFYARVFIHADLGLADSYILQEFEVDNLTALLKLFLLNREEMNQLSVPVAVVGNFVHYLAHTRLANTITNSLNNISAHYDLGNELFSSFLDETMMYSSGVFKTPTKPDDMSVVDYLKESQLNKIEMLIRKADIQSTDNVLEIGTGWGTFAIEAVKRTGCFITTITLSREQKSWAEEKVKEMPKELRGNIKIMLLDYRKLPETFKHHSFDKIVSIEMMEAVGPEYLSTYFSICDTMLKQSIGSRMVFQCITMPESRYDSYCKNVDFIQKHIFPGGHCPTVTAIVEAINFGAKGALTIDALENIGPHYAPTLAIWRQRFLEKYDELKIFPKTIEKKNIFGATTEFESFYSEEFKRKWVYYFCYCEAGFAMRSLGNVQVVLAREGTLGSQQDVVVDF